MKKLFCILFSILIIILCFCGCDTVKDEEQTTEYSDSVPVTKESETVESESCFTIIDNGDYTYTYEIRDNKGSILLYESQCKNQPHIEMISDSLLRCMIQSGTGILTQHTFYVNVETGAISETFNSAFDEHDGRVAYFLYLNSNHYMVVQDIFDKEAYFKEIEIPGDYYCVEAVVSCVFSEDGESLELVCKAGEDYTETPVTLEIE